MREKMQKLLDGLKERKAHGEADPGKVREGEKGAGIRVEVT